MNIKRLLLAAATLALGAQTAIADPILVNRGLPTANLNNAAGGSRSNVGWDFAGYGWFAGDDFTLGGTGTYLIDEIKFWLRPSTGAGVSSANNNTNTADDAIYALGNTYSSLGFYLGDSVNTSVPLLAQGNFVGTGSNSTDNANISITRAQYANAAEHDYQVSAYGQLFEVTMSNLNLTLMGGVTYQFGAECRGPGDTAGGAYTTCFAHSSNAALSGSPQDGSDGLLRAFYVDSLAGPAAYDSSYRSRGNGWDKDSDVNIEVRGTAVPEPSTLILLGIGLFAMLPARFRRKVR